MGQGDPRPGDPERIEDAIAGYRDRMASGDGGAAPYDSASLTIIYAPRVQELVELRNQGFTHAAWKWDDEAETNRWHGVTTDKETT
jgi:hypothetical protein